LYCDIKSELRIYELNEKVQKLIGYRMREKMGGYTLPKSILDYKPIRKRHVEKPRKRW
jgi:hypothetical protein